jgi:CRISPR/Cas system-associated endonuclease Cas1
MLSFGYSLLANRLGSALAACDIDPRLGIFHQGRGRHFALASDLLEQFRHVSERLVLALIHRREVTPGDFNMSDSGPCRGKPGVIGLMIRRMEETLARERILADNGEGEGKTRSDLNGFLDRAATQLIEVFQRRRPYDAFRIR